MTGRARVRRIGLAGAGWVAPHHLDAWQQLGDRARVIAIADPDLDAARRRATAYGIDGVYDSARAMLDAGSIDAIDIASPRETHVAICRLAADRGLAILCQKPLAPTLAEAEALVRDLGGRARLMVHENWRFRPHYRRIAAWLRDRRVGEVRTVTMSLLTSGLIPDAAGRRPALERQPMFATLDRLLVMELLIHHIDTLRFLLGPLVLRAARLEHVCPAVRGEDRASLSMTSAAGAPVSLRGDLMADGHPPDQFDRLEIVGTSGVVSLERGELRFTTGRTPVSPGAPVSGDLLDLDLAAHYRASYLGALTHFLDRLDDGAEFETSPADNLETLRIVEAAYRM